MRILEGQEKAEAERWLNEAAVIARRSTCLHAHCGTVIVSGGECIGVGYNSPPLDREDQRTCNAELRFNLKQKYDRTCCIHAEWRAILDALRNAPEKIAGATLYFMRVDADGKATAAGDPYCTVCSRLALDSGVSTFVLAREEGIAAYTTDEYNLLSYRNLNASSVDHIHI